MAQPLVTLFTDAGFDAKLRLGVWASWAKSDGITHRKSGVLKGEVFSSGQAESAAAANGLTTAVSFFAPASGATFIIQLDSTEAIAALEGRLNKYPDIVAYVRGFARTHNLKLMFRHVKGHRGNTCRRSAVNTWCDRECTRQLLIERTKRYDARGTITGTGANADSASGTQSQKSAQADLFGSTSPGL